MNVHHRRLTASRFQLIRRERVQVPCGPAGDGSRCGVLRREAPAPVPAARP